MNTRVSALWKVSWTDFGSVYSAFSTGATSGRHEFELAAGRGEPGANPTTA